MTKELRKRTRNLEGFIIEVIKMGIKLFIHHILGADPYHGPGKSIAFVFIGQGGEIECLSKIGLDVSVQ